MGGEQVIEAKRLPRPWGVPLLALYAYVGWTLTGSSDAFTMWTGWAWTAFAAMLILSVALSAIFPPNLIVSEDGFRVSGMRPKRLIPWSRVDRFWALRTPIQSYVFYALVGRKPREAFGLWVFRGLPSEADGRLLSVYKLTPETLAERLNELKTQHAQQL